MAINSPFEQIYKADFFSVLTPGFYSVLMLGFHLIIPKNAKTVIGALNLIVRDLKRNPFYFIFLLFVVYLFGSIIRVLKVNWAEIASQPYHYHFHSGFPFHNDLKTAYENIKNSDAVEKTRLPSINLTKGVPEDIFNYWKDFLCTKNDKAFEYYESFENRTRFSAGMVWAGIVGMIASFSMLLRCAPVGWQMFGFSFAMYLAFGFHLRRVRKQEVRALLFLYLAHFQP
jgi:hypothetical protein